MTPNEKIELITKAVEVMKYYVANEDITKSEYKDNVYFDNNVFANYWKTVTKSQMQDEERNCVFEIIQELPIFTRIIEYKESEFLGLVSTDLENRLKEMHSIGGINEDEYKVASDLEEFAQLIYKKESVRYTPADDSDEKAVLAIIIATNYKAQKKVTNHGNILKVQEYFFKF